LDDSPKTYLKYRLLGLYSENGKTIEENSMRIERKEYLERLRAWRDKQVIKVITGVRRCGKSVLLEMYAEWLREQGVLP